MIYERECVPVKELTQYRAPKDIECGMIEINLKRQTWLMVVIYRPPSQSQCYFFVEISRIPDHYCS